MPLVRTRPVDIVGSTGHGLDSRGPISGAGRYFSLCFHLQTNFRARSAFYHICSLDCFLGGKASRSLNVASYVHVLLAVKLLGTAPIAPYIFLVVYLITHRDHFNFDDLQKRDVECD
jgi:hypothetical protein